MQETIQNSKPYRTFNNDEQQEAAKAFRKNGFVVIKNVLTDKTLVVCKKALERIRENADSAGRLVLEDYYEAGSYKVQQIFRYDDTLDFLIDHSDYFTLVRELMGDHVQLMGTEIFVRGTARNIITGFHTDLGLGMQALASELGRPFLQVKMQLFLTSLEKENMGNFIVIPGSHLRNAPASDDHCFLKDMNAEISETGNLPNEAIQILAEPGDVVFFTHNLWHAVAPNRSDRTRLSISLRYGQLCLRPLERFDPVLDERGDRLSPRQRRLLCDFGTISPSPYKPTQQDNIMQAAQETLKNALT